MHCSFAINWVVFGTDCWYFGIDDPIMRHSEYLILADLDQNSNFFGKPWSYFFQTPSLTIIL